VLERDFFRELPRMLARLRLSPDDVADLSQRLRIDLVVGGEGRSKKLLSYAGTGPLGGWLRAVAMRAALSDLRRPAPPTEEFDGEIMGFATAADDTMRGLAKAHANALGDALRASMSALPPRDRNLLRMYVLDGANIDAIGRVYGVHRATVARWIGEIRVRLARDARDRMMPRVSGSEVTSLARLCFSQLDLSLDRLLADGGVEAVG
jgi:RNA polymerase sigma-70 factor (ECF subfamily)